jgi:LPXTG-motif cell wall-anchored protein
MFVRLGAVAAGGVLALAVAAPAYATDGPVALNPDHQGSTAAGFDDKDCSGPLADVGEGEDGWHFVLPANSGDDFLELTLQFTDDEDNPVEVVIDSTDPDNPSTGPGWEGFIDNAGDSDKHAYLITEAGWTLVDGVAQVSDFVELGQFNLSHTCVGKPGEEPSPSPSPSEPAPSETPPGETPPGETPPGEDDDDEKPGLPVTGLQTGGLVALGVALLAGGAAMLVVRRRRDLAGLVEADE